MPLPALPPKPSPEARDPGPDSLPSDSSPSDSALLSALAAGQLDSEQIARRFNIRLDLFLDWASAPETIKRLNMLIQSRAHVRHQQREAIRDEALNNLVKLQREAIEREDPVEARRTATGILRFTSRNSAPVHLFSAGGLAAANAHTGTGDCLSRSRFPMQYRTRSRIIRAAPILREPPAILSFPEVPVAAESPAAVTTKLLHRLQDSDNPLPGDGLRSLFNHFTPAWHKLIGVFNADDFAKTNLFGYVQLIGHHSAVLLPTQLTDGAAHVTHAVAATQEVNFIDLDGFDRRLVIKFTRESAQHPWLINDIRLNSTAPPDPAPCNCPECKPKPPPPTPPSTPPP